MAAPPPTDAKLDTPEALLAVAQRMLGGSDRFRTVESRLLPDSAIGDCLTRVRALERAQSARDLLEPLRRI